jgi:hypothetical protein
LRWIGGFWVGIAGFVGFVIGERKERPLAGFAWGALLGPVGWLVVGLGSAKYACPFCGGDVPGAAVKCRHCASDLVDDDGSDGHLDM